jgi:hypothetical protein
MKIKKYLPHLVVFNLVLVFRFVFLFKTLHIFFLFCLEIFLAREVTKNLTSKEIPKQKKTTSFLVLGFLYMRFHFLGRFSLLCGMQSYREFAAARTTAQKKHR